MCMYIYIYKHICDYVHIKFKHIITITLLYYVYEPGHTWGSEP